MPEPSPLWIASARKEVMDLLVALWSTLDTEGRNTLSRTIVAGPPDDMLSHIDEGKRAISRDRRIFDRIIVLDRLDNPPLTEELSRELVRLRALYPSWRTESGERAHFSSWMETSWGTDTSVTASELANLDDQHLIDQLLSKNDDREAFLDAWRQFGAVDPHRAFRILEQFTQLEHHGRPDVWEYGLWGLRDSNSSGAISRKLMGLMAGLPEEIFSNVDVSRGAADLLEAESRTASEEIVSEEFWRLLDRTIAAAAASGGQTLPAGNLRPDWVSIAINTSIGRAATALLNVLFAQRPRVGQGLPEPFAARIRTLLSPAPEFRPARVIAATRTSYLHAIDPTWARSQLLPGFNWDDEEESIALWQGYAWQARIDPALWSALKPSFILLFQPDRLARLGSWARNMAQLLMLVGVAFGIEEVGQKEARNAIRAMTGDMRHDAAAWVTEYMEQQAAERPDNSGDPDKAWTERVAPWIKRVWPADPGLRSRGTSDQFALAAIATNRAFGTAVDTIRPYLLPSESFRIIRALDHSVHPSNHPIATLELLEAAVTQVVPRIMGDRLSSILHRMRDADHQIAEDHRYRRWAENLAQNL